MTAVEVRPVCDRRSRKHFIHLPWRIYRDDPNWVPPLLLDLKRTLDPKRGPFYRRGSVRLFVAYRGGEPVGRITAHIDRIHDRVHSDRKGFFGFFECERRQETADALLGAAERCLRAEGRERIEGPRSFTIYEEIGILVDGFDRMPFVMNPHNPVYYGPLLESAGYTKAIDWYAFHIERETVGRAWPARLSGLREKILSRRGFELRPIKLDDWRRTAMVVKRLFDAAWSESWDHVPIPEEEFLELASGLKRIVIPELSYLAFSGGEPVGFALSVSDPNPVVRRIDGRLFPLGFLQLRRAMKRPGRFRLMMMGVLEPYRRRGIDLALYTTITETSYRLGYEACELSNVAEENREMLRVLTHLPVDRHKTYRLYQKSL